MYLYKETDLLINILKQKEHKKLGSHSELFGKNKR